MLNKIKPDYPKSGQQHAVPEWKEVVGGHFPKLAPAVEACLANVCALLLKDLSTCPSLVLVGPPSSVKTTPLDFIDTTFIYISDNFTPASFVSHAANVERDKLEKNVDLLPKLRGKVLMVKDFAPIFSKRPDDLEAAVGVLTRMLDGRGYMSDSGIHGQRGYKGDYRFAILAATTPLKPKTWEVMSKLGPRLLFYRIDVEPELDEEQLSKMRNGRDFRSMVDVCQEAVSGYLQRLWNQHGGFGQLEWEKQADEPELKLKIVRLANLGVRLRAIPSKEGGHGEHDFTPALMEGPDRYREMLYVLARGHAISEGRFTLGEEDLALVVKVTLSTALDERRLLLSAVLNQTGPIGTGEAAQAIGCSEPTARIVARDMGTFGILEVTGEKAIHIQLAEQHHWLRKFLDTV